jgi:alanine racemase
MEDIGSVSIKTLKKTIIRAIEIREPGQVVSYGLRYIGAAKRRIAVVPINYDGDFPQSFYPGDALIHNKRAPLVGGIGKTALKFDITDIPKAKLGDDVVIVPALTDLDEIAMHQGEEVLYEVQLFPK